MSIALQKQHSPVYPASLRVGGYTIVLGPDLLRSLKGIREEEAALFLVKLIELMGLNRYLREMLEEAIEKEEDQETLVDRLREQIRTFPVPD